MIKFGCFKNHFMEKKVVKKSTLPTYSYYSKPFGTCWLQSSLHYLYRHFYDDIMKANLSAIKASEEKSNERSIIALKNSISQPNNHNRIANLRQQIIKETKRPDDIIEFIKSIQKYFQNSSSENLYKVAEKYSICVDETEILNGGGHGYYMFLMLVGNILKPSNIYQYYINIGPSSTNPLEQVRRAILDGKDIFFEPYCEGKAAYIGKKENSQPEIQHVIFCENLGNGEFKLHDNIKPEQTKIVDSSFFEREFSKLQYAKNHHECLNDYRYMNIKYRNREKMIDGLSGKGENSILIGNQPSNYQKNEEKDAYVLKNGRTAHSKSVDCKYHTQTGLKKIQTNNLIKLIDQSKTDLDAFTQKNKMKNELRNYVYSNKFNLGLKSDNKLDCDLKSTVDKAFGRNEE